MYWTGVENIFALQNCQNNYVHRMIASLPRIANLRAIFLLAISACIFLVLRSNAFLAFEKEVLTDAKHLHINLKHCPDYTQYSTKRHNPLSTGKRKLPMMRPRVDCRTFHSKALEFLIKDLKSKISDPDLARLMENTLPNTLDTTILWHKPSSDSLRPSPQTFVVTGDIHAEWLRDSARQLSVFQPLVKYDHKLKDLMKGAINTQANYIMIAPYCNAFHPPVGSGVKKAPSAVDDVKPKPDWVHVFECKYEIDSLASFLTLTNDYLENSDSDISVIDKNWVKAYDRLLSVLIEQSLPLFDPETGSVLPAFYSFKRNTNVGTETLPLDGTGNPVNFNTGLVRSAFRPSDDATILQFFVPGNVHMLSELKRTLVNVLSESDSLPVDLKGSLDKTKKLVRNIERGLKEYAIVEHPKWGKVFAYEVDGYGGQILMDDANLPSLLSLPETGFVSVEDEVYQNTRKMILSKEGNPYYLKGPHFEGVGGPHIGIQNAWPMSLIMRIRTSTDDEEIAKNLETILDTTAGLGMVHESVNVNSKGGDDYTRPWFAWCNSEFGKTILYLAAKKPHLIFKAEHSHTSYNIDEVFAGYVDL